MEGQEKKGKFNGMVLGTVVALIIAIGAYGFFKYTKKDTAQVDTTITPPPPPDNIT